MNRQGYEVQQEVARLCKAGNQEKAQKLSLSFANEFKQSSSYKTMSKCAPQAYMQMAEMMLGSVSQPQGTDASVNVCDHIQAVQNQNH